MEKSIVRRLKKLYWTLRLVNLRGLIIAAFHKDMSNVVRINSKCELFNLKHLKSGKRLIIDKYAQIFINPIDKHSDHILIIGENVNIGRYSTIGCSHSIILEDWVQLAPRVHITDRNHSYEDINTPITLQPIISKPILIKEHSWLGYGVQVMPGVTIGKHCVIAAGSIVTKDIPDYSVAAGIPAKVIKQYSSTDKKWVSATKTLSSNSQQNNGMLTQL